MKHRSFIAIALVMLLLSGAPAGAEEKIPWTTSAHLSPYSTPRLPWDENRRIREHGDSLYLGGAQGIQEYRLEKGRYAPARFWKLDDLMDFAVSGDTLCALDSDGLSLIRLKTGEIRHAVKLKNIRAAHNLPQLAAVPGKKQILAAVPGALYLYDISNGKLRNLKVKMKSADSALASHPKAGAFVVNRGKLFRWEENRLREIALSEPLYEKECYHIDVTPDGKTLLFGNPLTAYEIATGKITGRMPEIRQIRWGTATDPGRNLLYTAGWRCIQVLHPADNPAQWRLIGQLDCTGKVPVYTHRAVAPVSSQGSLHYLRQTDELLFSGRIGMTVFSAEKRTSLVEKNDYTSLRPGNEHIPGSSALHRFLRRSQLVGVWVSTSSEITEDQMQNFRKTGVNALIHQVFQIEHGTFYPPGNVRAIVKKTGLLCQKYGMRYLVALTPYNISINNTKKNFRQLILPSGSGGAYVKKPRNPRFTELRYPCYLDREYSEQAGIEYNMTEFAKLAQSAGIDGIVFELGDGFTPTNIRSSLCFCDDCFRNFCKEEHLTPPENLPAAKRSGYLAASGKMEAYRNRLQRELANLCRRGMTAMQKIAPEMAAAVMLPETASDYSENWFYNAFIQGFQKKDTPVPVFSEQTYATPYMPQLCRDLEIKWAARGMKTILIPGLVNYWFPPEYLRQRTQDYLRHNPSIFYYQGYRWYDSRRNEVFYDPLNPFLRGAAWTLGDYIDAMARPHAGKKQ